MEQAKSILSKIKIFVTDTFDDLHQRREQEKQVQRQNQIHNIGTGMFNEIQYELFAVFQNANYNYLKPIQLPLHIRQDHFIVRNNAYIFYYQLDACNVPARSVLSFELQKYNSDISQFMYDLAIYYGHAWAYQAYPYIMKGIQVISADPFPASIRIGVSFPVPLAAVI